MRNIERLITIALALASVGIWIAAGPSQLWIRMFAVVPAALIILHLRVEGRHWQMFPAYLASLVLLLSLIPVWNGWNPNRTALVSAGLTLATVVFSWALPMFKLPQPTGQYPVGTRTIYLIDATRDEMHAGAPAGKRELVAQLWYPSATSEGPKAPYRQREETTLLSSYQAILETDSIDSPGVHAGHFPVLVFNHAWTGFRNRNTFVAQEMASHGFVVVAVSHTYNSSIVALPGGRIAHSQQLDIGFYADTLIPVEERHAIADDELRVQIDDCHFVLDTLKQFDETPGHFLEGHLDMESIGAYGYSYGGAVSVELAIEDPRVRCALELDGVLHGQAALEGLNKPLMMIDSLAMTRTSEMPKDLDPIDRAKFELFQTTIRAKAATLVRYGGYQVCIDGVSHENFSDGSFMSPLRLLTKAGRLAPRRSAQIIGAYMVAFFQYTLLNQTSALLAPEVKPFPEATLVLYPPEVAVAGSELAGSSRQS